MYSATLIFRTIKNGIKKKMSNHTYGMATTTDCHAVDDSDQAFSLLRNELPPSI